MERPLLAAISYGEYALDRARQKADPAPVAQYAFELAKALTDAYHSEPIVGGRPEFLFAIEEAACQLKLTMEMLSMYALEEV